MANDWCARKESAEGLISKTALLRQDGRRSDEVFTMPIFLLAFGPHHRPQGASAWPDLIRNPARGQGAGSAEIQHTARRHHGAKVLRRAIA